MMPRCSARSSPLSARSDRHADQTVAQARRIIEAQIAPVEAPLVSAIPAGTTLRAMFVTEQGSAFVDLSSAVSAAHPGGSLNELLTVYTIVQVLKQAGSDLSRENIMRQATNLRDLELPMLLPGIKVNTSPTDYWAVQQLQLMRFDGKRWVRFGDLVYDDEAIRAGTQTQQHGL